MTARHILTLSTLACLLLALSLPALAAGEPAQWGKIQEVNPRESWVIIDTQRLLITPQTKIRNLDTAGDSVRALRKGQLVRFTPGPQHGLLTLWIYPSDPQQLKKLGVTDLETLP
jgi:hypothetical protein